MRQLRVVGWTWLVIGGLGACALLVMAVRDTLGGVFGPIVVADWVITGVLTGSAVAGLWLRRGAPWARITIGVLSAILAAGLVWAAVLAMALGIPGAPGDSSRTMLVVAPFAVMLCLYSLGVSSFAGRKIAGSGSGGSAELTN